MTNNQEVISYVISTVGSPVVVIYNDIEDKKYYYLVDEFNPAIPSNYVFDNRLRGRSINNLLAGITTFSHGNSNMDTQAILTKTSELDIVEFRFPTSFKWIKFER